MPTPPRPHTVIAALTLGLVWVLGSMSGCQSEPEIQADPVLPQSTFQGPPFLRGTIGSLTTVSGYEPLVVSGFGFVVGLEPGAGSREIPDYLRQRMINMIRRGELDEYPGLQGLSPERILRLDTNAIVRVYGLIPPGASEGTTFDLLVEALPQTQTTSLAGGTLLEVDLSVEGVNPAMIYTRRQATGGGPIFSNPLEEAPDGLNEPGLDFQRLGVVVSGGQVTGSRPLQLILNRESFTLSAQIADRINERFDLEPDERGRTANAQSDLVIDLRIPRRYRYHPDEFIALMQHTFLNADPGFQDAKARDLLRRLRENPSLLDTCVFVCRAMGRTTLPMLRDHYADEDEFVRFAALEAGAAMLDERATPHLAELARSEDPRVRERVAQILARMPQSVRAGQALRGLVDDEDLDVRIAAYEALAVNGHPAVRRAGVYGEAGLKFIIDHVQEAERPLIYVTQERYPRIAIFGPEVPLEPPLLAGMWDNRLMLRAESPPLPVTRELFGRQVLLRGSKGTAPVEVYYRDRRSREGERYTISPTLTTFATLLGHRESFERPEPGLDLTYSQVVDAVFTLSDEGHIPVPVEVNIDPLVDMLSRRDEGTAAPDRPETRRDAPTSALP